jgi:biopolymer transport protein ExbD
MLGTSSVALIVLLAGCVGTPPLVMQATGTAEDCKVTADGAVFSEAEFTQARLQALAKKHGKRLIVESDGRTPYRCIGGALFNLQNAGFKIVAIRVEGVEVPSR